MTSDVVRRGYLKIAGEGILGFAAAKKRWVTLREKSVKGETRLEIFSSEKAEREGESVKQCVNLAHASHASRNNPQKHSFVIELNATQAGEEMVFLCESEADADDWVEAVNRQLVRSNALRQGNLPTTTARPSAVRSFAPTGSDQMFRVNPQNLHNKLGIQVGAMCMLKVTNDRIVLYDGTGTRQLADWFLAALRRYGRTAEYIQFEAGRRCTTGEGIFTMLTSDGEAIYQLLHANAQRLAVGAGVSPHGSTPPTNQHSSWPGNVSSSLGQGQHSPKTMLTPSGSLPPMTSLGSTSDASSTQSAYAPLTQVTMDKSVYAPLDAAKPQEKSMYQPLIGSQKPEAVYFGIGAAAPAPAAERMDVKPEGYMAVYSDLDEVTQPAAKPQAAHYEPLKDNPLAVEPAYLDVTPKDGSKNKKPLTEYAPLSDATKVMSDYQPLVGKKPK